MITRRDALKLSSSALLLPLGTAFVTSPAGANAASSANYPVGQGNPGRTGEMPGPAPRLDEPIIVRWKFAAYGDSTAVNFDYWTNPVIANGVVYAGGRDDLLYALDTNTGDERWHFVIEGNVRDAPAVHNNSVYVTTWGPNVYAIDASSGAERWRYFIGGMSTWGAVADDNSVYFSDGTYIRAVRADSGEEQWLFRTEGVASGPALDNGTLYISSIAGVHAVDATSGDELWSHPAGSAFILPAAISDGVVYAGDFDHQLHALDAESGAEIWRFAPAPPSDSTGYNQHLSIRSVVDGTVLANGDGVLYAVDSQTGQERWRITTDTMITPTSVVVDGLALIADEYLYVVDVLSGQEVWRDPRYFGDGMLRMLPTPVIMDGVAYIGYGDHFYALGNLPGAVIIADTVVRGAPSITGLERGIVSAGAEIDSMGARNASAGQEWVEVTIGDLIGWIPLEAIDPATLAPEGDVEYVYIPE